MDDRRIGVDLGSNTIKIIEIREVGDLFEPKHLKTYAVKDTKSEKEYFLFLKKCITDFLKINKIKFASFCFTINCTEPNSLLKVIKMPIVDKKTLQKSLKYEIEEREITTNLDDVYYNWQISESVDDEPSTEYDVLLAVIEKRIIKEFAKLKTIKWKIENIELQPITVGRLVRGDSVAIDFGHEATRIYMYKDGNLSNLETINVGGKHLSEIISKEFKYKTEEEIEGIKHQSYIISDFIDGSNSDELQRASELVTNEVKDLFNEIKRLIRSFELQNSIIVEDVYYLGGTSNILYFIELLERELEVRIRALDLLTPKDTVEYEEDLKQYTLASSAILYKKYNYFNDLNFSKNTRFQINLTPIIVGIACASIVMHAGTYYVNTKYDEHIEELQQVQGQQNSSIERLNSEISSINSSNSSARMSIDAINGLLAQQKWLSDILYILPDKVPTDTIISNILCEEGNILLKGYTTNYSDIGFFAIALEEFGQVTVDVIENDVTEPISPIEIEGVDDISDEDKISKSFVILLMYNGSRLDNTVIKTNGSTEPVEISEEIVERNLDIQVEKPSEDIVDADVEP